MFQKKIIKCRQCNNLFKTYRYNTKLCSKQCRSKNNYKKYKEAGLIENTFKENFKKLINKYIINNITETVSVTKKGTPIITYTIKTKW